MSAMPVECEICPTPLDAKNNCLVVQRYGHMHLCYDCAFAKLVQLGEIQYVRDHGQALLRNV